MNPDTREHPTLVAQYLEQLSGVQPAHKARYGAVLHHFQSFVPGAWADDPGLTLEALRQWLQNRMAVWPFDTLMHRLCMVDRFLDWLTLGHHLPRNPLADLRETYGRHNRRAVVRALLSTAPQQALEQLRPFPRFGSHLGAAMQDHLTRMRTLGYRYERDEYHLLRFDRYLQTRLDASAQPLHVLVDEWAVRRQAGASDAVDAALFWNEQHRRGYAVVTVEHLLTQVIRQAGLKPAGGRSGPRVHDLRHTFVVHRMLAWYHDGVNPQQRLHHLATWLGHKDINSTLVYLTITQELLQEASLRFHAYGAQALQTQERGASCH